jgi:hypothetical protein
VPSPKPTDHRPQLAQADESDLIRQLQDGGERLFSPVAR